MAGRADSVHLVAEAASWLKEIEDYIRAKT